MKSQKLDVLLTQIFDDEPIDSSIDESPDARQEREALNMLKADLHSLRHVPECQVSCECLRDAVLRAEMRKRRAAPLWVWIGTPLAAASALFAVWLMGRGPNSGVEPIREIASETTVAWYGLPLEMAEASLASSILQVKESTEVSTPSGLVAKRADTEKPRVRSKRARRTTPRAALVARVEKPSRPEPPATKTIVIINPDIDAKTGAKTAHEVDTNDDVVIGG